MDGLGLSVQRSLDGHHAVICNGELTLRVWTPVYREGHFAPPSLVRILGPEGLQNRAHSGVFIHNDGLVEAVYLGRVVVDITEFHCDPRTSYVVKVVLAVVPLDKKITRDIRFNWTYFSYG